MRKNGIKRTHTEIKSYQSNTSWKIIKIQMLITTAIMGREKSEYT
jgi:hypothetical protein